MCTGRGSRSGGSGSGSGARGRAFRLTAEAGFGGSFRRVLAQLGQVELVQPVAKALPRLFLIFLILVLVRFRFGGTHLAENFGTEVSVKKGSTYGPSR